MGGGKALPGVDILLSVIIYKFFTNFCRHTKFSEGFKPSCAEGSRKKIVKKGGGGNKISNKLFGFCDSEFIKLKLYNLK